MLAHLKVAEEKRKGAGVKKAEKIKTVCLGFEEIVQLSFRVNPTSLKLSASSSNSVCWTFCFAMECN